MAVPRPTAPPCAPRIHLDRLQTNPQIVKELNMAQFWTKYKPAEEIGYKM
jgi:hypothetical protein